MLIETTDSPICPNETSGPPNPLHHAYNRILDTFYEASERDDNGEFTIPAVGAMYEAVAYKKTYTGMSLYCISARTLGGSESIKAWYFRCHVCGFVLPASEH
jgi:hypothetical protein